jgi:K+-sensing histidine kinase KdpD
LSHREDEMYREGIDFEGFLTLDFKIAKEKFVISIVDNAGGFPESVLANVYRKPVTSSKRSRSGQAGEGTVYSGFFVDYMGGAIFASNVAHSPTSLGAATIIEFPLLRRI